MSGQSGTVYLLCLTAAVGSGARHYLGWSGDHERRLEDHRRGRGARLLAVANGLGVGYEVVRTWEGLTREDERRMKECGHLALLCPGCGAAARARRNAQQRARRARSGRADRPRGNPRGPLGGRP